MVFLLKETSGVIFLLPEFVAEFPGFSCGFPQIDRGPQTSSSKMNTTKKITLKDSNYIVKQSNKDLIIFIPFRNQSWVSERSLIRHTQSSDQA